MPQPDDMSSLILGWELECLPTRHIVGFAGHLATKLHDTSRRGAEKRRRDAEIEKGRAGIWITHSSPETQQRCTGALPHSRLASPRRRSAVHPRNPIQGSAARLDASWAFTLQIKVFTMRSLFCEGYLSSRLLLWRRRGCRTRRPSESLIGL